MERKDDERWLSGIRDKMSGYEEAPSRDLFDAIADGVAKVDASRRAARRRRRVAAIAASIALFMGLGTAVGLLLGRSAPLDGAQPTAIASADEPTTETKASEVEHAADLSETTNVSTSARLAKVSTPVQSPGMEAKEVPSIGDSQHSEHSEEHIVAPQATIVTNDSTTETIGYSTEPCDSLPEDDCPPADRDAMPTDVDTLLPESEGIIADWRDEAWMDISPRRSTRLAMGVNASTALGGSVIDGTNYFNRPKLLPGNAPRYLTSERWHPTVPVTVGLTARYEIFPAVAVESGLTFTALRQQRDLGYNDGVVMRDRNTVLYLGIPLAISYRFAAPGQFRFYLSAGGRIEFAVSNVNELTLTDGPVVDLLGRNHKGIQASINAALGAELMLGRWVSLYLEPGVGYYFDENTRRPVVYERYPLVFQLTTGFRFNI